MDTEPQCPSRRTAWTAAPRWPRGRTLRWEHQPQPYREKTTSQLITACCHKLSLCSCEQLWHCQALLTKFPQPGGSIVTGRGSLAVIKVLLILINVLLIPINHQHLGHHAVTLFRATIYRVYNVQNMVVIFRWNQGHYEQRAVESFSSD